MTILLTTIRFLTSVNRRIFAACVIFCCICQVVEAAPAVGGDIIVANNKVGAVVVLSAKAKIGVGIPGLFMPQVGIPLNFKTHNINSIIIDGGHVRGDVQIIDSHTPSWMILGKGSNVNTVLAQ